MADKENEQSKFLCGLLMGGILGALAGLLLAPKPGRQLRSELRERGEEAFEDARQFYAEAQEKAKTLVEDARRRAEEMTKEAERYLAETRAKAKKILAGSEEKS